MKRLIILFLLVLSQAAFSQQITKELTIPIKGMENFTLGQLVKTIQLDDSTFLLVTHLMDDMTINKNVNQQPIFFKLRNSNTGFKVLWRSKQYLDTNFSAIFGDLVIQDGKYKAVFLYQKAKYFNYPASCPFYPFFIDINSETGEMIDSVGYLGSWQSEWTEANSKICYIGDYNYKPNIKYDGKEMIITVDQLFNDTNYVFNKTITKSGEIKLLEKVSKDFYSPKHMYFDKENNILRYYNSSEFHYVYYYKMSKLLWSYTLNNTQSDLDLYQTGNLLKGSGFSNEKYQIYVNHRDITRPIDRVFAYFYDNSGLIKQDTIQTNDIQFCREYATEDSKGNYYLSGHNNSLYPKISFQVEQYNNSHKKSIVWKNDSLSKYIAEVFSLEDDKVLAIGSMNRYNSQTKIWENAAFYLAEIDFSKENGVEENAETSNIDVWPNPAGDFITITLDNINPMLQHGVGSASQFTIYNTLGEKVMTVEQTFLSVQQINISQLPKGIYFVKVGSETAKFVKL
jgi:hypothetical protein